MKILRLSVVLGILAAFCGTASGARFSPTPISINTPSKVNPGGISASGTLSIPFTLNGDSAAVVLAVYTSGKTSSIGNVQSGNYGWHYMDGVDSCVYVSTAQVFAPGCHTMTWNGRDRNGNAVPYSAIYRYYFFAVGTGASEVVTDSLSLSRDATLVACDGTGAALANPVIYGRYMGKGRKKWVVGTDPASSAPLETASYTAIRNRGGIAFDPDNPEYFFTMTTTSKTSTESGDTYLECRKWTANGEAALRTAWGDSGRVKISDVSSSFSSASTGGPIIVNGSLLLARVSADESKAFLDFYNPATGALTRSLDITSSCKYRTFSDSTVKAASPLLAESNGKVLIASAFSRLVQVVDPAAGTVADLPFWMNGFRNLHAESSENTDPLLGYGFGSTDIALTGDGFAFCADYGIRHLFVFGPDGTEIAELDYPDSVGGGYMWGIRAVDTGSLYDGLYFSYSGTTGVRYTGYDVCSGEILTYDTPGAYLELYAPAGGNTLKTGAAYSILWGGESSMTPWYPDVRIELSSDGGSSWTTLADSATGCSYTWTVPSLNSSTCRMRITTLDKFFTSTHSDTTGNFNINDPSGVDAEIPVEFTVSAAPNPFNPSTAITYAIPADGQVSLTIYDVTGRKTAELVRGFRKAGTYSAVWDAKGCASGMYFCVVRAGNTVRTQKLMLMK